MIIALFCFMFMFAFFASLNDFIDINGNED